MSIARWSLAALVAALAAAAFAAPGGATNECRGIRDCIDVKGPWVAVPAGRSAVYLLECPRRRGVVGGTDALASSQAIRVSFDGLLGGPVAAGTTTTRFAFFRALSITHRAGSFQPLIGCIPVTSGGRQTTSARAGPPGPPLDLAQTTLRLHAGATRTATLGCPKGEQLVDSWDATAFRTSAPPPVSFANAIRVARTVRNGQLRVTAAASEVLPSAANAEVQAGVVCSTS
jgi:hypothetical protein